MHEGPLWDWSGVTFAAVADRAGVNERTVYRYFSREQDLQAAVMKRLEDEADMSLEGMRLDDVRDVASRSLHFFSSFPLQPRTPRTTAHNDADRTRRDALIIAVNAAAAGWSPADRTSAAAALDLLWSLVSYERLVTAWELDPDQANTTITWVIGLVEAAIRAGHPPLTPP
jgi:AcrR family transcriptional regulator